MGKYTIFCDMDQVLTDLNQAFYNITGIDITGIYIDDDSFWQPIRKAGLPFWEDMPWTKDGKILWEYISKYNPSILSAPSQEIESRIGKMKWVARELPGTKLILRKAEQKRVFANPESILIDDLEKNVQQWIESGGIGILHTSTENTINELKKLGL